MKKNHFHTGSGGYGLKPLKEKNLSTEALVNSFKMMNDSGIQMKAKQIGEKINAEKENERIVEYLEHLIFSRIYPKEPQYFDKL